MLSYIACDYVVLRPILAERNAANPSGKISSVRQTGQVFVTLRRFIADGVTKSTSPDFLARRPGNLGAVLPVLCHRATSYRRMENSLAKDRTCQSVRLPGRHRNGRFSLNSSVTWGPFWL